MVLRLVIGPSDLFLIIINTACITSDLSQEIIDPLRKGGYGVGTKINHVGGAFDHPDSISNAP